MLDIFDIAERLRRMPRQQRIETIRQMAQDQPPKSLARRQLERALKAQVLKQLIHEARRKAS